MAFDPVEHPAPRLQGAGDEGAVDAAPSDAAAEPEAAAADDSAPRAASDGDAPPSPAQAEAEGDDAPAPQVTGAEREAGEAGADAESQLATRAAKADEYLALAQRTKADFENYRRRALREAALAQDRGVAKLAKELLPAVDNLDRALSAAQAAAAAAGEGDEIHAQLLSGIELVHADVISALQRAGIEAFSPEGEAFDPQWHEAVAQAPIPDAQSGSVVEVYQRGYRLGESMLRPARVLVAA